MRHDGGSLEDCQLVRRGPGTYNGGLTASLWGQGGTRNM